MAGITDIITLSHGDGGVLTNKLVRELFLKTFSNDYLDSLEDGVVLDNIPEKMVVSTDSFVVSPLFFPGGDIGKMAVCGTVNDLAVSGALPRFLTVSFILEEGLSLSRLEKVVVSMGNTAREAGVTVVAGDTKVVENGHGDGIFINTTGIGYLEAEGELGYQTLKPGDKIVINGTVGEHGLTILTRQQNLGIGESLKSDCASLKDIIKGVLEKFTGIRIMRDPTRGGLATTLKEIADLSQKDFEIWEDKVPVEGEVKWVGEILGLDPLYLANEGKFITIIQENQAEEFTSFLRQHPLGSNSEVIGEVQEGRGQVLLKTFFGGTRPLNYLAGAPLPRIC